MQNVNNLAQFKRFLQSGGAIELIDFSTYNTKEDETPEYNRHQAHKGYGVVRKAEKVQTKSVKLEGGSWLDLDPARYWSFNGDTITREEITVKYWGGYDEDGSYNAQQRKAGEYGNKLTYKLIGA